MVVIVGIDAAVVVLQSDLYIVAAAAAFAGGENTVPIAAGNEEQTGHPLVADAVITVVMGHLQRENIVLCLSSDLLSSQSRRRIYTLLLVSVILD